MERRLVGDAHAAMFRPSLMKKSRQQSGLPLMDIMTLSSHGQLSMQKMFHKHKLLLQRRANVVG